MTNADGGARLDAFHLRRAALTIAACHGTFTVNIFHRRTPFHSFDSLIAIRREDVSLFSFNIPLQIVIIG